ncbi:hypothetical protein [Streptomyces beihaiensis]|uniref:Secreted protein n=1 Tax=Streptomyces beihaiensis TaxID=2984495 RepID=A0ABT3U3K9_9ACTN|nr:hypothetical protein [Streptomyces beihaiensis]MCX3063888.1 hypothetical protein [Streptomyces beihaiensis]
MRERTALLVESLLLALVRALLPARGRHRVNPAQPHAAERPLAALPARPLPLDVWPVERDTHLVRPYLLTPEERRERRLQRGRRRALWLAVHGVDVGPRHIHGTEVSA